MRPHHLASLLSTLLAMMLAARANATVGVPSPQNCSVSQVLVGTWDFTPASTGPTQCSPPVPGFEVVVRDLNNSPLVGVTVELDMVGAGLRLYQTQPFGTVINCSQQQISRITDAFGRTVFVVRAGGVNLGASVRVLANGIFLAQVPMLSPDYNADGAVGLSDFGRFASGYLGIAPHPESEFDNCPGQDLPEYSFFSAEYLANLGQPPAPLCP
jgi:hypothetical protein